jgi:hypothetical protein
VRNGARLTQIVILALLPIGEFFLLQQTFPSARLVSLLVLILGLLLAAYARRFGRVRFTSTGIDRGDGSPSLMWKAIAKVKYSEIRLWLRDTNGRTVRLPIGFAKSSGDIIAAVREHVPPDVILSYEGLPV